MRILRHLFVCIGLYLALLPSLTHAQDNYEIKAFHLEGVRGDFAPALREALATKAAPWLNRLLFWRRAPLFSVEEFQRDLQRIVKFYELQGYFQARVVDHKIVADDEKLQVRLWVKVEENQPTRVIDIKLAGPNPLEPLPRVESLFKALTIKVGDPLREAALRNSQAAMTADLTNHGFPFANAGAEVKREDASQTAKVVFRVKPGPAYRFGEVQVTGNQKIPQRIIREELPFVPGELFSQRRLIEGQQRVYRLELFQSVNVRALADALNGDKIPIEVRVREAPLRTLKAGVGYGTEELFRATINFRRRNFLGGARRLEAEVKYSDLEPGRIQARVFQPHFIDPKTTLIISPFYLRRHEKLIRTREIIYKQRSFGGELTAQRQFSPRTNGYLRYRLEDANVTPGKTTIDTTRAQIEIPQAYKKASWGLGLSYNSSQPLFSPTRGQFRSLQIDYSGPWSEFRYLNVQFHYVKAVAEARFYHEMVPDWLVMAYRLKLGALEVLDDALGRTALEERFYAGGSASVRGWQRSQLGPQPNGTPTGGQSLLEGSMEPRFKIFGPFGAALFVDFGNVWSTAFSYKLNELHYAAGLGLRYETPIGPIRLDAARKINRQPSDNLRWWEFYISVGQAF
ncbi:BamA/TamA family outer membrane protein [candidate division KSB1 bacterium]|nr:BamA/TamA family outer membrane protein [candidate division KSB1 bacterium]